MHAGPAEGTATVAERVVTARHRAAARGVVTNGALSGPALESSVCLSPGALRLIERHVRSGALSARGLNRVRRLARTLADLDGGGETVGEDHVQEALLLRSRRDLLLGGEGR
jgi:magnesium chelatase family protein